MEAARRGGVGDQLPPAVAAFDAIAGEFDARFGEWRSVAAQRRAVRRHLLGAFPPGEALLELGGGTGEDALHLAARRRRVLVTDGSPAMVARVRAKAMAAGLAHSIDAAPVVLEDLEAFARERVGGPASAGERFDGAYSNFAALNCVADLGPVARGLAALLRPGAPALLVVFGPFAPGEVLVQLVRGDARAAVRRLARAAVPARIGGRRFTVRYPRPRELAAAFAPWFRLERIRGIGVLVPPSAAEPWISGHPRLLAVLEALDRLAAAPLARLGDHVLLHFVRTPAPAPGRTTPRGTGAPDSLRQFRAAYASHRAREGRGAGGAAELLALPYLRSGPMAAQWRVRARTFDRFVRSVVGPLAGHRAPDPLRVLDLGAGNGWLCYRMRELGHEAIALDMRDDAVDGLGAGGAYRAHLPRMFARVAASFDAVPLPADRVDLAVFNASLHYALDLRAVLAEAARVVAPGGRVVVLDSPFYAAAAHGEAMIAEKRRTADRRYGELAGALTAPAFVEYLTPQRLADASDGLGLRWRRRRVRYPLRYEMRPLAARLRGRRPPSRFDLWEAEVPR